MAALAATALTLLDWAKRIDPDGRTPVIAELLSQSNEILDDCLFKEGNLPTGDRVSIRTGLPTVYWRALNAGVPSSKSTTAQVDEGCGMLEARSEVDKDLAELNGNSQPFRLSEDKAFIEAMNQEQADTLFHGNVGTNPKQFTGLATRYSSLTGDGNSTNVMSAGGSGSDNASVYLVVWGDNTVYCPFPKGSMAGLKNDDLGLDDAFDASNNRYRAYITHYQWKTGLVVKDWRYVVRICNIDISDLNSQATTQALTASTNILKLMTKAAYKIPNLKMGRPAFYMNRTVHSALANMAQDKSSAVLKINEATTQFGQPDTWLSFLGIPMRRVDALTDAESAVA